MHLIETLMTDQIFSCLCQQFLLDNVPHVFSDIYVYSLFSKEVYDGGREEIKSFRLESRIPVAARMWTLSL